MNSKRDDFTDTTKRLLAERVGWKCSFPNCSQDTVGPSSSNTEKRINNGVAAHICAAAEGGPRYDATMTPEERKSPDNGIWMCRNHGTLIDSDDKKYTPAQLKIWRENAEALAYERLSNSPHYTNTATGIYSDQDKRAFEFINGILPYEVIQLIKEEIFGKFVREEVIQPFNDLIYYSSDPANKFQNSELESLRINLIEQAKIFIQHFKQQSAGLIGGYDYIDFEQARKLNPKADRKYYEQYAIDTQRLANTFCATALEFRGKQQHL